MVTLNDILHSDLPLYCRIPPSYRGSPFSGACGCQLDRTKSASGGAKLAVPQSRRTGTGRAIILLGMLRQPVRGGGALSLVDQVRAVIAEGATLEIVAVVLALLDSPFGSLTVRVTLYTPLST